MSEYMPGPWTIEPDLDIGDDGETATLVSGGGWTGLASAWHNDAWPGVGEANARLIAAAPALFAALERICSEEERPAVSHDGVCSYCEAVPIAREAIALVRP